MATRPELYRNRAVTLDCGAAGGGAPEAFIETFPTISTVQRAEGFSDASALQSADQHAA